MIEKEKKVLNYCSRHLILPFVLVLKKKKKKVTQHHFQKNDDWQWKRLEYVYFSFQVGEMWSRECTIWDRRAGRTYIPYMWFHTPIINAARQHYVWSEHIKRIYFIFQQCNVQAKFLHSVERLDWAYFGLGFYKDYLQTQNEDAFSSLRVLCG